MATTLGGAIAVTLHGKGTIQSGINIQASATAGITTNQPMTYEAYSFTDATGSTVNGSKLTFGIGSPTAVVWAVSQTVAQITTAIGTIVP